MPAICTNIGGLPELLENSEGGCLCPLGDIDAFTSCARRILTDDELWSHMSRAARRHAVDHFDIEAIIPRYESYLERVRAEA